MEAAAEGWQWHSETVDTTGTFSSLKVDKEGNLHISYYGSGGIMYGFRPAGGAKWYTMTVEGVPASTYTAITIDHLDNPHICYTPGILKYASWNGHKWIVQEIAPGSGQIYFSCAVVVNDQGVVHLSWQMEKLPDGTLFAHVRHAVFRGGVWEARTIDSTGQTGKYNAMVGDEEGYPHICYADYSNGILKYGKWTSQGWELFTVEEGTSGEDANTRVGLGCSLVETAGQVQMSFEDTKSGVGSAGQLRYAKLVNGRWLIETVDSVVTFSGWQSTHTSLALDQDGFPHISYEDSGTLKHAYWDGKAWHVQVIATAGNEPYRYSSIAIDQQNTIYISYRDPLDSSLKVAIGRPLRPTTDLPRSERLRK